MCRYQYAKYGACEHSVIECRELCGVALWRAGATGKLVLCVPSIVGRPIQDSGPKDNDSLQYTEFVGFTGSCNACIKKLQLYDNVRLRDEQFDYITISEGQLSPDTVFYFQVEQLLTTFPHLLAIDQHLAQANMDMGPAVLFPEATEKLTWAFLRTQQPYQVSGFWATIDGPKSVGELLDQLQCPSGLSFQDRQMFIHVLMNNLDVNQFYKDVFLSRGMPYSLFSRICAQIRNKAMRIEQQKAERAAMATNPKPTSSRSASLNGAFQDVNFGVAGGNHGGPEGEGLAVSLPPASLTQANMQRNETGHSADNTNLQHLGDSDHITSDAAGSKRSFSTMQEENTGSNSNTQQSHHDQEGPERPAQRPRLSEPVGSSTLDHGAPQILNATTGSSPQLTMNTADESEARSTISPAALSSAPPMPMPQQPLVARSVGHFDLAACRAMQEQARAAQAVPMQPLSAAVAQTQAAAQAAQAHAAEAPAAVQAPVVVQAPTVQAPAVQLPAAQLPSAHLPIAQAQPPLPLARRVDTSRDEFLQAQFRQSHAPSKMAANRARASRFTSAFNHLVESGGLMAAAAHAGIHLTVGEVERILEAQRELETQRAQEDGSHASSPPSSQCTLEASLVDPALIDQSAATQSPSTPTITQHSPQDLSVTTPTTGTSTTAASSPTSQQPTLANTEDVPGKGKCVLPHVVEMAQFFLNDQERDLAVRQLTSAWTAYRNLSETSIAKERAALWIVNFSLNFRQQWTKSADSYGAIKNTTLMELTKSHSGVRASSPNNPAPSAGADHSQPQEDSNVGDSQTPQFQHTMHVAQAQN